ncbi:fibrillarin-like rRNA methylase [Nocardioides flavus (ex Wang et al. 2016)]|uniref:Protein-L-isoaspartate O-methyltransferase n=1 Tax=Nocardioides flavus (ex Wang et al. 2016) TaxID=2058780 RepID=A0ABQ3HDS3_9ACTN|nr:class I SAM-dependent methyltransferase [Nocardioides flavus (ex Wang et al. 2016)]GHE15379.1 fibrillarin-like rRNA methylase [Nocardioides flavus (ex Wang et al. 2016)]
MDAVRTAFDATPRRDFLPEAVRRRAAYDGPLDIAAGQTSSQPRTVVDMLRLLDVRPGQRVLDVGAGSGWTTALLAHLVGPTGTVLGVELEPELVSFGGDNLARTGRDWATIRLAVPGELGDPAGAPYDRILVSAMARALPTELVDQLAGDGVLVIPVAGRMLRVANPGAVVTEHGHYRFVPLR